MAHWVVIAQRGGVKQAVTLCVEFHNDAVSIAALIWVGRFGGICGGCDAEVRLVASTIAVVGTGAYGVGDTRHPGFTGCIDGDRRELGGIASAQVGGIDQLTAGWVELRQHTARVFLSVAYTGVDADACAGPRWHYVVGAANCLVGSGGHRVIAIARVARDIGV